MLHRSSSSRRRRASRSAATSPAPLVRSPRSSGTSPGRRASIAVSPVDSDMMERCLAPEMNKSPRHSIIPNISLDEREHIPLDNSRSSRHSMIPDDYADQSFRSPRNSLVPDSNRSPRNSLVPTDGYSRSARNSLVPDSALSPRNSLVPDYNRSSRNSLVPDVSKSPRNSLVPDSNKSPRSSLVPGDVSRSPRHSITPESNAFGSRLSLAPDFNRSPRNSLIPENQNRSARPSLTPSESSVWKQTEDVRGSRYSVVSDSNRSPRGSIAPDTYNIRTSPRGSIASEYISEKSGRCNEGEYNENRSPRGSIGRATLTADEGGGGGGRTPRGSLTLTFQEPPVSERRGSADNAGTRSGRSTSPYRSGSRGNVNTGYNATGLSENGSRRASSSVSQVSGDEQRRLCADPKYTETEKGLGIGLALTTYGSVAYQLKDANLESSGTCDFVCKALTIVNKTVVVTVVLILLSALPLIMLIMGIQFLRDCPQEANIPIYMVVGGTVGGVKMGLTLYNQLFNRRQENGVLNASSIGAKVASIGLTVFLIAWFSLGNYWILHIKWPEFAPKTIYEPNQWCHRTLYMFALVHLCIVYSVIFVMVLLMIVLAGCQLFGCPWLGPTRYK